jgi:hypothetical protein
MKEADEEKMEKKGGGGMSFGKRMAALRKSKGRGKKRKKGSRY